MKQYLAVLLCVVASLAAGQTAAGKKGPASKGPAKEYLQTIWNGWATLDPTNVAQYYVAGPNTFFDIAPLKYGSWQEYSDGAKQILAGYKSARFTLNDDTAVHSGNNLAWVTSTVKYEMTKKAGTVEAGNMRWTAIFENQNGKWMIVHEHVSAPLQ